ncbi:MAG TPA: DinB family protein [Mucilaginibacter sp.]
MGIGSQRKEIDGLLDTYRSRLDTIPDDLFNVTPPGGGWSYAEVYSHILQADIGSTIAIEKCTLNSCIPTSKGRSFLGLMVLSFGRFPPIRVKVPEDLTAKIPAKNISKEEARNLLIKCRKRIDDVTPLVHDASPHHRINHRRLGMLNARQWLKFIVIHTKHHLKQLDRIQKKFHSA